MKSHLYRIDRQNKVCVDETKRCTLKYHCSCISIFFSDCNDKTRDKCVAVDQKHLFSSSLFLSDSMISVNYLQYCTRFTADANVYM